MAVDVEHPNPTLAPCPFCGNPQPIPRQLGPAGDGGAWYIACDALGCGQTSEAYGTRDVAIARWNCRVPIYVPLSIVDALKDCPCCGLKAAFQTIDGRFTWVVCPGCRLATPPMGTTEAAARLWNRRLPVASASALVRHLREEIVKLARRFEQEEAQASSTRVLAAVHLVIDRLPLDDAYPTASTVEVKS